MWAIKYNLTTNRINIKTRIDLKRESLRLSFKAKNIKIVLRIGPGRSYVMQGIEGI